MTTEQLRSDTILQADWLQEQSGLGINDLLTEDPELFDTLAREWRQDHPDEQYI